MDDVFADSSGSGDALGFLDNLSTVVNNAVDYAGKVAVIKATNVAKSGQIAPAPTSPLQVQKPPQTTAIWLGIAVIVAAIFVARKI